MKKVKIKLLVIPLITLGGKKYRYLLGDMAYGEWLVYKNNYPQYYLSILETNHERFGTALSPDLEAIITSKLKLIDDKLKLKQNIIGLKIGKSYTKWFELEKLPSELFM